MPLELSHLGWEKNLQGRQVKDLMDKLHTQICYHQFKSIFEFFTSRSALFINSSQRGEK